MAQRSFHFVRPRQGLRRSDLGHVGWTLLSALMLGLIFPRPGWSWLAFVALVPVTVLAIRSESPRILILSLYGVFSLWWIWMIRWLWPVTGGGEIGLAMFMAVYWTAALYVVRHLHRAWRPAMVITLPLVWVSFEILRSSVPQGGFGWFCIGHSQAPWMAGQNPGLLIQSADVLGQAGVSFLVVMTSGLIVDWLTRPLLKPWRTGPRRFSRTLVTGTCAWALCMIAAASYGLSTFRHEKVSLTHSVQVAVVQTDESQSNKDATHAQRTGQTSAQAAQADEAAREAHLAREQAQWQALLAMTDQAAATRPRPEIIIWPETMVPRPVNPEALAYFPFVDNEQVRSWPRFHEQISFLAADLRTNLVVGASSMTFSEQRPQPFIANSVFVYDWRGVQYPVRYDKIHRVPFGEYIPWVENWPWLKKIFIEYLSPYKFDYSLTPGTRRVVFPVTPPVANTQVDGSQSGSQTVARDGTTHQLPASQPEAWPVRLVTPICFEDTFPTLVRSLAYDPQTGHKRANIIANLTNDGWFAGTNQPLQHLQMAVFRSIELRMPTARSVNMGVSGFIDSMGRVGPLVHQDGRVQDISGIAAATMKLDGRSTFYGQNGSWFSVIVLSVTAVLTAAGLWRRWSAGRLRLEATR